MKPLETQIKDIKEEIKLLQRKAKLQDLRAELIRQKQVQALKPIARGLKTAGKGYTKVCKAITPFYNQAYKVFGFKKGGLN